jgi:hypothetical protein
MRSRSGRLQQTVMLVSVAAGMWILGSLVGGGRPRPRSTGSRKGTSLPFGWAGPKTRRDDVPKPPDALMFRWDEKGELFIFNVVPVDKIEYWRWMGWYLLANERDIRQADIEDVRRSDEDR